MMMYGTVDAIATTVYTKCGTIVPFFFRVASVHANVVHGVPQVRVL